MARLLVVLLLVAATAVVLAGTGDRGGAARPLALRAGGPVSLSNTRANSAVFTASALRPGRSTRGRVAIRNTGTRSARLALTQTNLQDVLGPGGGRLSGLLQLRVRDVGSARTVYSGPLASMPRSDAGSLAPGQSRTYELTAHLPDGGRPRSPRAGDNAFKGSTSNSRYVWTATESLPVVAGAPCRPSLRVPRGQRLLRRGRMIARVRVSRTCRVTVRAYVRNRAGRKRYLFGTRDRHLVAGRTHRVTLRLARTVKKILRSRRLRIVQVSVRAGSTTVSRRVRVR